MSVSGFALIRTLESAASQFAELDLRFVALALALQLSNLACRSLALRSVLAAAYPAQRLSVVTVGAAYAAGAALNAFVPARGGDALKIALLRLRIPSSSVPTIAAAGLVLALLDGVIASSLIVGAWALGVIPVVPTPSISSISLLAERPVEVLVVTGVAAVIVTLAAPRAARRARDVWARVEQGGAILRTPGRYLRTVVPFQIAGWACRIGVAYALLAAFGIAATLPLATVVVLAGGLSTLAPTPGGAGTQQVMLVYVLRETATAASALAFSVGMQVGITTVNTLLGLVAMLILFRTIRPSVALEGIRASRPDR